MGSGAWTSSSWSSYKAKRGYTDTSTTADLYKSKTIKDNLNPFNAKFRESCDSAEHPNSTPIILGLDVTGSMGSVLESMAKNLNTLITQIYEREPVKDPQVMVVAFGDTVCDKCPLQVSQFESDIRIAEQLNDVFFERGGGGNGGESYILPWYFAARHTKIDSFEKRGKKGILFTMGDEPYLDLLSKADIEKFVGDKELQADLTAEELLSEVSRQYEVYHLMIEEGSGMRGSRCDNVVNQWTNLLGQRAISVSDHTKIPEIIVSILELHAGKEKEEVISSWDNSTALVVSKAINALSITNSKSDLVEF